MPSKAGPPIEPLPGSSAYPWMENVSSGSTIAFLVFCVALLVVIIWAQRKWGD